MRRDVLQWGVDAGKILDTSRARDQADIAGHDGLAGGCGPYFGKVSQQVCAARGTTQDRDVGCAGDGLCSVDRHDACEVVARSGASLQQQVTAAERQRLRRAEGLDAGKVAHARAAMQSQVSTRDGHALGCAKPAGCRALPNLRQVLHTGRTAGHGNRRGGDGLGSQLGIDIRAISFTGNSATRSAGHRYHGRARDALAAIVGLHQREVALTGGTAGHGKCPSGRELDFLAGADSLDQGPAAVRGSHGCRGAVAPNQGDRTAAADSDVLRA